MLTKEQTEFIITQSRGRNGKNWLGVLESLVESLYSTRGVPKDKWEARQLAADFIEKNLIDIMKVGEQEINKSQNNEYI